MRKSVLMILFLLLFSVGKAQYVNMPNDSIGISVQAKKNGVETGYLKYNHLTNRLTLRGDLKPVMKLLVTSVMIPFFEVYKAQQGIFEYLNVDGTIRDTDGFNEAMRNYLLIKRKYGM